MERGEREREREGARGDICPEKRSNPFKLRSLPIDYRCLVCVPWFIFGSQNYQSRKKNIYSNFTHALNETVGERENKSESERSFLNKHQAFKTFLSHSNWAFADNRQRTSGRERR